MFIADQPYVSDAFFRSMERLGAPVLQTSAVQEFNLKNRRLNLWSEDAFFERFRQNPNATLYCNSENGLRRIVERAPESAFAKKTALFKDKAQFRRAVAKIYPDFYFREIELNELERVSYQELPKRFVFKPSIGFLSLGVRFVSSEGAWESVKREILRERAAIAAQFPPEVVDPSRFLVEEAIPGEEIAVDAFFDADGNPVVLDVLRHPFSDANDVRDRIYETSPSLVRRLLPTIESTLARIGAATEAFLAPFSDASEIEKTPRNRAPFPFHFEFRLDAADVAVPIEINPGRFAGWHTTELARHAYEIDVYEYFANQKRPDWSRIFARADAASTADDATFFAIFERSDALVPENIAAFDYDALKTRFSRLFELREIDFRRRPIFAIAFAQTADRQEINDFLKLDVERFVRLS